MHRRKLHLYSNPAWVSGERETEHLCDVNVRQRAATAARSQSDSFTGKRVWRTASARVDRYQGEADG
jgi:hypothetical protein